MSRSKRFVLTDMHGGVDPIQYHPAEVIGDIIGAEVDLYKTSKSLGLIEGNDALDDLVGIYDLLTGKRRNRDPYRVSKTKYKEPKVVTVRYNYTTPVVKEEETEYYYNGKKITEKDERWKNFLAEETMENYVEDMCENCGWKLKTYTNSHKNGWKAKLKKGNTTIKIKAEVL